MRNINPVKVVAIGGGTGLPVLLRGLRTASRKSEIQGSFPLSIAAVVTVADNGGSSGLLRECFDIPAVGDLRNCLLGLSEGEPLLASLFQHRFTSGNGLKRHALGNLILTALLQKTGSLKKAIALASQLLQSKGYVFPVTETPVTLCAELEDGTIVRGEAQIPRTAQRIARVWLDPANPPAAPGVLKAISSADLIVLGPGSLYTSIVPNLLVEGVARTLHDSPALKIFVCNLMTQPGETDHFTASDHLRVLASYLGSHVVNVCVLNSQPISPGLAERYLASGAEQIRPDDDEIARMRVVPILADLLPDHRPFVGKHDCLKLGRLILFLTSAVRGSCEIPGRSYSWVA